VVWILATIILITAVSFWLIEFRPLSEIPPISLHSCNSRPNTSVEAVLAEAAKAIASSPAGEVWPNYAVQPSKDIPDKVYQRLQQYGIPIDVSSELNGHVVVAILGYWQVTEDMWIVILSQRGGYDTNDRVAVAVRYIDLDNALKVSILAASQESLMLPPEIHIFSDQ
jgi:hypothetical protein